MNGVLYRSLKYSSRPHDASVREDYSGILGRVGSASRPTYIIFSPEHVLYDLILLLKIITLIRCYRER